MKALHLLAWLAHSVPLVFGASSAGEPEWLARLDEAFARASETGRPLLIVFR
jgi:hypothetical protein